MSGLRWNPRAVARVTAGALKGLSDGAEFLLEEANRTVPHEEGTLQRSGQVSLDEASGQAAVSYDTPYAVAQHERTALRHDEGRRAKWLQLTATEQATKIGEHMAAAMKAALA